MRKHVININIIIIIMIIICVVLGLMIVNKKVRPIFLAIAQDESKRISNIIINDSVKKEINNGITFDKLFIVNDNDNNSIVDFDTVVINRLMTNINDNILLNIKYLENGDVDKLDMLVGYNKKKLKKGIIYEIPLSTTINNIFLSNLCPKIPVKIHYVGNIESKIRTKITNYGINNALVEVYIDISINLQIILPLLTNKITTNNSVPIAIKMVHGNIPQYFSGANSSFSIPIE